MVEAPAVMAVEEAAADDPCDIGEDDGGERSEDGRGWGARDGEISATVRAKG